MKRIFPAEWPFMMPADLQYIFMSLKAGSLNCQFGDICGLMTEDGRELSLRIRGNCFLLEGQPIECLNLMLRDGGHIVASILSETVGKEIRLQGVLIDVCPDTPSRALDRIRRLGTIPRLIEGMNATYTQGWEGLLQDAEGILLNEGIDEGRKLSILHELEILIRSSFRHYTETEDLREWGSSPPAE